MNWTHYALAWILPAFAGAGIWLVLARGIRSRSDWAAALGGGWIVGLFFAAWLARWLAVSDTAHAFGHAAPWLAGIGVLAWAMVAWRRLRGPAVTRMDIDVAGTARNGWRWLGWALLALVAWRLVTVGGEALLRPVFPWDAWSAWSVKPKTWFLLGHAAPYVPVADWLAHPGRATLTVSSWDYPELLAWIELWFASAAGAWNEPLVDIAWCGALTALLLAAWGQWRAIGVAPWLASMLVYGLASLPLVDAHAALAGYADLWLAVTLGLAALAWSRWLVRRETGQWLLAIVLALWLPSVKLEGAIWLSGFAAIVVLERIPVRWRWRAIAGVAALVVSGFLLGGFLLPLLGLGWVRVASGGIHIAALGSLDFGWHPVGRSMIASLFTLPNWHLLWYLLPALALWRWRALRDDAASRLSGGLLLLYLFFLFALFFFTDAAAWAADYTSANRLILQIVPVVFVFVAVLLRQAHPRGVAIAPTDDHPLQERALRATSASVTSNAPPSRPRAASTALDRRSARGTTRAPAPPSVRA
ncbi:MAG TPA: hypothetical protein VFG55_00650 [Rhodanobacteraceae bacterium]|nr:hypothetical protein [Rhodanobacteraceae bacterium]